MIYPVLLCGGAGTRLWPLSRKSFPKQFTSLTGAETLFQSAALMPKGPDVANPSQSQVPTSVSLSQSSLYPLELAPGPILIKTSARIAAPAVLAAVLDLSRF